MVRIRDEAYVGPLKLNLEVAAIVFLHVVALDLVCVLVQELLEGFVIFELRISVSSDVQHLLGRQRVVVLRVFFIHPNPNLGGEHSFRTSG